MHIVLHLFCAVPNKWATFSTSTAPVSSALNNTEFTITCEVNAISGISLPVSIKWFLPNGDLATTQGRLTVGDVMATNSTLISSQVEQACGISPNYVSISTLSMTFDPVDNSDGGVYTCQATINIPWMIQQPQQLSTPVEIPVTSKISQIQNNVDINYFKI